MHTFGEGMYTFGEGMHTFGEGMHTFGEEMHTFGEGMHTFGEGMHTFGEGMHTSVFQKCFKKVTCQKIIKPKCKVWGNTTREKGSYQSTPIQGKVTLLKMKMISSYCQPLIYFREKIHFWK